MKRSPAWLCLALVCITLWLHGCITPEPGPKPPLPSSFLQSPNPPDGAYNVTQPAELIWSYVGTNFIAQPAMDVVVNGRVIAEGLMACRVALPAMAPNYRVNWYVLAYTDAGVVTGAVWSFTTATEPAPPPPPPPSPASGWRFCTFIHGSDIEDAGSELGYRAIHGEANENARRKAMPAGVAAWGGNVLTTIIGEFWPNSPVLNMAIYGAAHPDDGHYFPIREPTNDPAGGEVDWASWMKQAYGVDKILAFIFNDNTKVPFTQASVQAAVKMFKGSRVTVAYGTCLESDEVMSVQTCANVVGWTMDAAPGARVYVGSSKADYLISVFKQARPGAYYWLEQSTASGKNPITDPVNLSNLREKVLNKVDQLVAAGISKDHICVGEIWSKDADRLAVTKALRDYGVECSGQFK